METDPNPINLADSNELVSVKTPKSLKEIPGLLMALLAVYYPPGFLKKVRTTTTLYSSCPLLYKIDFRLYQLRQSFHIFVPHLTCMARLYF